MSQSYNDSNISALIGAERIRKKPASMLGSSGLEGSRHGFTEIYGNALDEASTGFGDKLDVTYHADGSISVRDYGRGVPLGWSDSIKNWNWHNIYNELYSGGKYNDNQEQLAKQDWDNFDEKDYNYLYSVGLNGLGAASTQYTSEFFTVKSYRDGVCKMREFKKGMPLDENGNILDMFNLTTAEIQNIPEIEFPTDEPNGTYIHWKPDIEVFSDVNIGGDWLFETCKHIANVANMTLSFKDEQTGRDITIEKGNLQNILIDNIDAKAEDVSTFVCNNFTHGIIKVENKDFIYVCKVEIDFAPTDHEVATLCFHNSVKMQSGVQYEAVSQAIHTFMTEQAKRRGIKLDTRDYIDAFGVVVSSYSNWASFRNQTKDAVDDYFVYDIVLKTLLTRLREEYAKGNSAIVETVDKVIHEAEIRIATKEQEKIIRDATKVKREKEPEKFVSCVAYEKKQYDRTELWITEGDSAKGAVKNARDKDFQAIYPIRGKGLNVFKKSIDKILKNQEIREIFSIIGTGFDLGVKGEKLFNIDDLRFDKIIFATDADEDGYQIRVLLFLTFYRLAPQLITDGHVYIAETPRFKITLSDGSVIYARNDADRDKILNRHKGKVSKVNRFKGLGEVNAKTLRETTVAPETRNLVPVTCDLTSESERYLIDALFGADKYNQRKAIITSILGEEVAEMLADNALIFDTIDEDEDIDEGINYETV